MPNMMKNSISGIIRKIQRLWVARRNCDMVNDISIYLIFCKIKVFIQMIFDETEPSRTIWLRGYKTIQEVKVFLSL